jgi:hypothetical protein
MQDSRIRRVVAAVARAFACPFARVDVGRTPGGIWYSVGGIGDEWSARIAAVLAAPCCAWKLARRGRHGC